MQLLLASRCMPRTTIDIDASVLHELKRRQRTEKRPLGELASELLAEALAGRAAEREPLRWAAQPMGARVDIDDKEALRRALEGS
jgi:Arc/MetJ family transcription regulator